MLFFYFLKMEAERIKELDDLIMDLYNQVKDFARGIIKGKSYVDHTRDLINNIRGLMGISYNALYDDMFKILSRISDALSGDEADKEKMFNIWHDLFRVCAEIADGVKMIDKNKVISYLDNIYYELKYFRTNLSKDICGQDFKNCCYPLSEANFLPNLRTYNYSDLLRTLDELEKYIRGLNKNFYPYDIRHLIFEIRSAISYIQTRDFTKVRIQATKAEENLILDDRISMFSIRVLIELMDKTEKEKTKLTMS